MDTKEANRMLSDKLDQIVRKFDGIFPEFAVVLEGKDRFQIIDFYMEQAEKDHRMLVELGEVVRALITKDNAKLLRNKES